MQVSAVMTSDFTSNSLLRFDLMTTDRVFTLLAKCGKMNITLVK
jgi:hypothetical protein